MDEMCIRDRALDVYRPKATNIEENLPVIVSVHGGGWVYSDKEGYQYYCTVSYTHLNGVDHNLCISGNCGNYDCNSVKV